MINNITLHPYRLLCGENENEHNKIANVLKAMLKEQLNTNINQVDIYRMQKTKSAYTAGRTGTRVVILINNTTTDASDDELTLEHTINGIEHTHTLRLAPSPSEDNVLIISPEGDILAEWIETAHQLNILFDVLNKYSDANLAIFEYLMEEFNQLVWEPKKLENSWLHSKNKQALTKTFTEKIKQNKERRIREDIAAINHYEEEINHIRRNLKQRYDTLLNKRRFVEMEQRNNSDLINSLITDLDLIVNSDKVIDLHIIDNMFHIFTDDIYITSDKGKRYYGGKYEIIISLDSSDVRFKSDNPRHGYWGEHDPHPHVNGNNGEGIPCLGSVADAIAELSSQMQLYALVLTCIDFLESANTRDDAGRRITHWDEVDKDGNIIVKATSPNNENQKYCGICENYYHEDDFHIVFEGIDEDGVYGEALVCEDCREMHYQYVGEFGEYVDRESL